MSSDLHMRMDHMKAAAHAEDTDDKIERMFAMRRYLLDTRQTRRSAGLRSADKYE